MLGSTYKLTLFSGVYQEKDFLPAMTDLGGLFHSGGEAM